MIHNLTRNAVCAVFSCILAAGPVEKMEVSLERKTGLQSEAVDPNHVFDKDDLIRFRFKSSFNGYLYVINHSTSGKDLLLFPNGDAGLENHIQKGHSYVIPMTQSGWFRVEGPPGHEVTYWLVSPAKLSSLPTDRDSSTALDPSITPRCDDEVFRARGDCVDATAGAKSVLDATGVPAYLSQLAKPRELTVMKTDKKTSVLIPPGEDGPFIYTFRVAHR